jgi:hypothetical protein
MSTAQRTVDNTDKFHRYAVTSRLDDTAAVLGDLRIDQFLAMHLELAERAFLVGTHQPAIAGNIASHDRGQSPIQTVFRHLLARRPLKNAKGHEPAPPMNSACGEGIIKPIMLEGGCCAS